jgi:integration host factor subunit beta
MTKSQLIEKLAQEAKIPKTHAETIINGVFDSMVEAMKRGEKIEIRGFGSFSVRSYKPYTGRNPKTNESVHVKPKKLPFFRVGKELREQINKELPTVTPFKIESKAG